MKNLEYLCLDVLYHSIPSLIAKNRLNVDQAVQWYTDVMNELLEKELKNYFQID